MIRHALQKHPFDEADKRVGLWKSSKCQIDSTTRSDGKMTLGFKYRTYFDLTTKRQQSQATKRDPNEIDSSH